MPGIAGVICPKSEEEGERLVQTMIGSMLHERSYVSGTRFVREMGIYGGWVAHDGSFAARLAMQGESDDPALLVSGECFLSSDRSERAGSGASHDGGRRGGQVLRLYAERQEAFVGELNGLFGGLLIDRRRKRALLFNDRYGIERIYLYEKDGTTFFASEAKALLRVLPELRVFDDEGVAQFLTYGCTLDGRTLFRNVRFLPGGSLWTFDGRGGVARDQYFRPGQWASLPELTEDEFESEYLATFRRILPGYLLSDSGVGISLTGGLDTRMIMAGVANTGDKPVCYTFAGITGSTLDERLAARVAGVCGLEHHILRIGDEFLRDFGRYVDRTVFVTDGCAGALTAHEIYLNALASRLSPVRVTGNFGSEILRGMSTFKRVGLSDGLVNPAFGRMMDSAATALSGNTVHPVAFAAFREIPWSLFGSLAAGRSQVTFRTPYLDNELVALAFRAPAAARQSPRASLRLVNESSPVLAGIPTDRGVVLGGKGPAHWLRRLFAEATFKLDYLHKEGMPDWLSPLDRALGALSIFGVLGLHKFLPYRIWFRQELAGHVRSVLTDPRTRAMSYWNGGSLPGIAEDHVRGRKNHVRDIHAILTLEAVDRVLIRGSGAAPGAGVTA